MTPGLIRANTPTHQEWRSSEDVFSRRSFSPVKTGAEASGIATSKLRAHLDASEPGWCDPDDFKRVALDHQLAADCGTSSSIFALPE
jgi:hypothetical protein